MTDIYSPSSLLTPKPKRRVSRLAIAALLFVASILFIGKLYVGRVVIVDRGGGSVSLWGQITGHLPFAKKVEDDPDYVMPAKEDDRIDILVLGMRGADDPDGGSLTDTIMLLSYDRTTKRTALVSIPRDLWVKVTPTAPNKINAAYENLGLSGVKKLVSQVTGVYVDYAVLFDFSSFHDVIDTLGGVDITLAKPFTESQQWAGTASESYVFTLPAGENHLDGDTALYYVRSRYSSSDFDRAWRQQQVVLAIKQKLLSLNILSDPGKILSIMNIVRKNVKTDYNLGNIPGMIELANQFSSSSLRRSVLTTENFLVEDHINGAYVLLPYGGSFSYIKQHFAAICTDTPAAAPNRSTSPSPTQGQ